MKYKVIYETFTGYQVGQFSNYREEYLDNNGKGFSLKEAMEIAVQLSENGMQDIIIIKI